MPIPKLPGIVVPKYSDQDKWLKMHVARLCQFDNHERFPGSQPVSFASSDLAKLETQDFWVCEKSDGIRVLFLVVTNLDNNDQTAYLIDRHNEYRQIEGFFFPHHENPQLPLRSSLVDGELVIDVDPRTKQEKMRFLAFDCLVIDDQNVMSRPLDKRYGRLKQWFFKPHAKMLMDHPKMMEVQPFSIKVKDTRLSYHVENVFNDDIPALQHGNDGLIYTCVNSPYTPGTDPNILKWKPPSENSIDFKLVLRFPPTRYDEDEPDWTAKPVFLLHVWNGGGRYELYDDMYVNDDEWEELKKSGEQVDDRIVEVHWDSNISRWRMMRFRDDKPNGNHKSVVENIISSIADGVEKEALLERSNAIRAAWKARLGQPQQPQPQAHQYPHTNQMRPPPVPASITLGTTPRLEFRYGPLAQSRWSKVAGPPIVLGMKR
ncbi:mRNA-capping enzyme subunit alpha [Psilocybe cubensis]|uniref:mRNA-capping enzyme subunit alpha n=2 Tax=Psilocybe cubensis TaxID=181762 RepID=A0ACB8H9N7_PSICU|nr:mRNA-capping enzyme subunit alpha [Psilocybe cubensis]KAH9484372.1 mRNA-capping enzyme subunit alpha [Psilocybe cubensis]